MGVPLIAKTLLFLGVWFLMGIVTIGTGLDIKKRGIKQSASWHSSDAYWQKQVERWGIAGKEERTPVVQDVMSCWGHIYSLGQIYSGLALILTVLCSIVVLLITQGTSPLGGWLYWTEFVLSFLLGQGLGYMVGVSRMRAATFRLVRYGDLRPRTLSDYRSPLWWLVPAAYIVYVLIATGVLAPSRGPTVDLPALGTSITVPTTLWAVWAGPVALALIFIASEVVMRRIATLPRLLVTTDPATAQRADEMLRARILATIQGLELYALAFLSFSQWGILSDNFRMLPAPWLITALTCTGMLALLGILIGTLFKYRVGGRVTGWPWQPLAGVP
jgi:hypothetical protein